MWKKEATEAVLEFLEDTPGMARAERGESVGQELEGEEGRPGPP